MYNFFGDTIKTGFFVVIFFGLFASSRASQIDTNLKSARSTSPEALEMGAAFLKARIPNWRSFGSKLRWYKTVPRNGNSDYFWHAKPSFELSRQIAPDGTEHIVMCNDRYSAKITKRKEDSEYRLVHIDEPYDVSVQNRRRFDSLSYTFENEYLPDLIESGRVKVSAFDVEGDKSKIWLTFSDETRKKTITPIDLPGNIQLIFGEPPNPIGSIFETGERGKTCQIHRISESNFEDVEGELLGTESEYVNEIFYANGKRRTISHKDVNARIKYLTGDELESQQCYLGYYGLDEPAFAAGSKDSRWKTIGVVLISVMLLGVIWWYRNRRPD